MRIRWNEQLPGTIDFNANQVLPFGTSSTIIICSMLLFRCGTAVLFSWHDRFKSIFFSLTRTPLIYLHDRRGRTTRSNRTSWRVYRYTYTVRNTRVQTHTVLSNRLVRAIPRETGKIIPHSAAAGGTCHVQRNGIVFVGRRNGPIKLVCHRHSSIDRYVRYAYTPSPCACFSMRYRVLFNYPHTHRYYFNLYVIRDDPYLTYMSNARFLHRAFCYNSDYS